LKNHHKVIAINKPSNNKLGFIALLKRSHPINLLTGPVIYAMILPITLLDVFVWFYQLTCFPIYKLQKFKRAEFIIFDRQELKYLDWISKFHCTYCAYAVGVINLASAIIGATESYFCPIKHNRNRLIFSKKNYINFKNSDEFDYDEKLESLREELTSNKP